MSAFTKGPKVVKVTTILEFDDGTVMTSDATGEIYNVSFSVEREKPGWPFQILENPPLTGLIFHVNGYGLILESKMTGAPG